MNKDILRIAILGATSEIAKDLILSFLEHTSNQLTLFARRHEIVKGWMERLSLDNRNTVKNFSEFDVAEEFDVLINFVGVGDPAQAVSMGGSILDITFKYDNLALDYLELHPSCRYIFLSSGAVYGSNFNKPADETTTTSLQINNLQPQDWYSVAKLHAECRHRAKTSLPITDIRVFNYFSHTQNMEARFFITDVVRAIRDGAVLKTTAEYMVRDYIHPSDFYQLVSVIIAAPPTNAAVDCYSKAPVEKLNMLKVLHQKFGLRYDLLVDNDSGNKNANKPHYYSLNRKASIFGYKPLFNSIDSIAHEMARLNLNLVA
jgi:nucleoside-diphosphate-sugar epimerase